MFSVTFLQQITLYYEIVYEISVELMKRAKEIDILFKKTVL